MAIHLEDPSRLPNDICVFYSWQDHLDCKLHRFLIRDALKKAIEKLNKELAKQSPCQARLDSDTKGRAGFVAITDSILQKINACQVFVCDVTPVMRRRQGSLYYPNPNVMMELGYAAKTLGWHRVICVFNSAQSPPRMLPFNIFHRRLTPYQCKDTSDKKHEQDSLVTKLLDALHCILEGIGRNEFDPSVKDAQLKRERDIQVLEQVMETIHRRTIHDFIQSGRNNRVYYDAICFWEDFNALLCMPEIRFYDDGLTKHVFRVHRLMKEAVDYQSVVFFPNNRGTAYVLKSREKWDKYYEGLVKEMAATFADLEPAFSDLLKYVHDNYVEIDMQKTDKTAWDTNLPYLSKTRQLATM